jgi:hypothetical protein
MLNQYPNHIGQHNNHINSLAAKTLRAHFTSFKSCAHKISRYVGC